MAILNGTAGDDVIHGTADADTIRGRAGDDALFGEGSNDRILGGDGHDYLVGNRGNDNLVGGPGEDTLIGGRGNDTLNGTDTAEEQSTTSVLDNVNYSHERGPLGVTVNLATGIAIDTYGHTDKLIDIEFVIGTAFADHLIGGDIGNDAFEDFSGLGGNDVIDGGSGFDRARYNRDFDAGGTQGVYVNLTTGIAIDGFGDTDTLISIEAVRGTQFDDTLVGDGEDNRFEPLSGEDHMDGGGGSDRVAYHNDHFYLGNGNGVVGIDADLGSGTIVDTSGVHVDTVVSIENVTGSILDDMIRGNAKANDLQGRDGDDLLVGRGGSDFLSGDAGDDILRGGPGNDILDGGTGSDKLRGGGGEDIFVFSEGDGDDRILGFQDGVDLIDVGDYGFGSGAEVVALAHADGNHTVIDLNGDLITLLRFDIADLDGGDFII